MELFFSPNGRITQGTYWRGALILFAISAVLTAAAAFVSPFLGMAGLIFIWPWIAIHVKRFHDAGKTGWLTLAMVVLAMIVSFIASSFLPGLFGIDQAAIQAEMTERMTEAANDDPSAMMSSIMEETKALSQRMLPAQILSTLLVTGIVGAVMGLFKQEPKDNQYGALPGGSGTTTTFS
jgi:uncharacterized membrane protein YhaH (DUF805 family)